MHLQNNVTDMCLHFANVSYSYIIRQNGHTDRTDKRLIMKLSVIMNVFHEGVFSEYNYPDGELVVTVPGE